MPTFGSLFAGIGGLDLGLERAGWTVRWQIEKDEFCRRVLARHWPDVARYGDITTLDPERLEAVDLICGGFPCQPVSVAGKRLAQADHRWLWPEFSRIVRALRPRLVLVENVPGLLVRGFGDVVGDLAASGYDAEWDCVSAEAVGAPHIRDRVWLVAYAHERHVDADEALRAGRDAARTPRADMADTDGARELQPQGRKPIFQGCPAHGVVDWCGGASRDGSGGGADAQWRTEPDVGRVAHGVPARVDRLRGLGNAVVPQVAEWIGRRLIALV